MVNSKLLYAAPVWTSALNNHAIQKKLFWAQRGVVLRIVSAYRTVSTSAVLVLPSVPLIGEDGIYLTQAPTVALMRT